MFYVKPKKLWEQAAEHFTALSNLFKKDKITTHGNKEAGCKNYKTKNQKKQNT